MSRLRSFSVLVVLFFAVASFAGHKHDHAKKDGKAAAAFEKMKALAGDWKGNAMTKDGPSESSSIAVTAGGSVVMETLFPGAPYEMITMYYMDGNDLVATHYCAGGNQPRMKLNLTASTDSELVFDFVGITGLKSADEEHIHDARLKLVAADEIESTWNSRKGSAAGETKKFYLRRGSN